MNIYEKRNRLSNYQDIPRREQSLFGNFTHHEINKYYEPKAWNYRINSIAGITIITGQGNQYHSPAVELTKTTGTFTIKPDYNCGG